MPLCELDGYLPVIGVDAKEIAGVERSANTMQSPSDGYSRTLDRCDQGMAVSETLEPGTRFLPDYFLPIVRAGETSGRLAEAFQLLYCHSHRVGPSIRLLRNVWLYPLPSALSSAGLSEPGFLSISEGMMRHGNSFVPPLEADRCSFCRDGSC